MKKICKLFDRAKQIGFLSHYDGEPYLFTDPDEDGATIIREVFTCIIEVTA